MGEADSTAPTKSPLELVIVPGFLGRPAEFNALHMALTRDYPIPITIVDWSHLNAADDWGWQSWPAWFEQAYPPLARRRMFLGYSMGGRLLLAYFARAGARLAESVAHVILVSTHPGLTDDAESEVRRQSDERWAQRFLCEEWHGLMKDWNQQSALVSSRSWQRSEQHYDRELLAAQLRRFSLSQQPDFRPWLKTVATPPAWHWWVGGLDGKFLGLAGEIGQLNSQIDVQIFARAGHRLLWEEPKMASEKLRALVAKAIADLALDRRGESLHAKT